MAVYKRGKVWWMSFQLNGEHVQKSTKCKNKRDAEAVERAYRTQLAKGEVGLVAKPNAPSFDEAIKEFMSWVHMEHRNKANTIRSYESSTNALKTFFGQAKIDEIEPKDVDAFKKMRCQQKTKPRSAIRKKSVTQISVAQNSETGGDQKRKWKSTPLKPATVNRELATLKIFFNYFIRQDILVRNPVSRVKLLKEDNCHMRVLSSDEERLYLMAANQPLSDTAILMLDTGMRPEEVARIERQNVFLSQGYIFVPFGKTKAARRKIPLTNRAHRILENRLSNTDGPYIFCTEATGQPLTTLKTAHAGALRRSGVGSFRLYDLRHTFATRFIESGGDLVTLQALLGHSNIQMVTRYAHPTERHQFESIRRMEASTKGRSQSGIAESATA
jgi:site-specific recombinase XerD